MKPTRQFPPAPPPGFRFQEPQTVIDGWDVFQLVMLAVIIAGWLLVFLL